MSRREPDVLDRMVARVVSAMAPEAIHLFGNRARGDATVEGDYDLLVVVSDDAPGEQRSLAATAEIRRDPGVSLDIVPCRRSVFERRRNDIGTLSYLATHEGQLLYGQ